MAAQNFKIKNGLTIGSTEVIDSSGDLTNAAFGTAALEAIDDQVNSLLTAGTGVSLSYDDSAGTLTINGQQGDITGVNAGAGLTGTASSGDATLNIGAGTGITVNADDIAIDLQLNNTTAPYYHKVVVTVSSGKFLFDGQTSSQELRLIPSVVYRFDQSDNSNSNHPLRFSESSDGSEMSDGYTIYNKVGTPGSAGSYTEVAFDQEAPQVMYFYCSNHSGMGNSVALGSGDIAGVTAGDGLSGGGTSGTVTLSLNSSVAGDGLAHSSGVLSLDSSVAGDGLAHSSGVLSLDLNELTAATVDVAADSIPIIDGTATKKESIADIVTAVAGDGLSASSGLLAVAVDDSSIETNSDELRVKASGVTNAMLAGSIANAKLTNSAITINSNSTSLGSSVTLDTGDIAENGNLYYTNERVDDRVAALIVGGSNITSTYDDAAGTLTLAGSAAYGDADARQAVSVTDSGGDGSLAYNNSSGVFTYTGPSASEVRAHITAGTGVGISSGEVSIGQAVATSSNVQFANLTLSGDLTVNGTTSTVSSTNTTISDALIELGNGTSGSPSNDAGFVIERGSSDNVFIGWDESADAVTFGTGSFTGASTGNLTITPSAVNTGALTITNASNSGGTARNVYQSTSAPTGGDGAVGDLWILYS